MVHTSLRQMVTEHLGDGAWERICGSKNIESTDVTHPHESYKDEVTLDLLLKAANEFDLSIDDFMELFGQSWIRYASQGKYKSMFRACGADIQTFIGNLDSLHGAISSAMPGTKTGSFKITSSGSGWLTFRYRAARPGLDSFLRGLMKGLMNYFNLLGSVNVIASEERTIEILLKFTPDLSNDVRT